MRKKLTILLVLAMLLLPFAGQVAEARYAGNATTNWWWWWNPTPTPDPKPVDQDVHVSSNRPWDWYMDQGYTGQYSGNNCGPTSVAMVMKWLDRYSRETGKTVRDWYPNNGDWWSTNMITSYFRNHGVSYSSRRYYGTSTVTNAIDNGNIVLVCMTMEAVSRNYNPRYSNKGKFYSYDSGHFLIIKGYKKEGGTLYFEVYDPNNWGMTYSNGQPMGKDRLYLASEVSNGLYNWWDTVYIIYD
ncbi:MAG: C39 family peptidase [Tissierellia bacterium]|nr:C39 family peptidase [Tissierellia bacterium]